MPTNTTYLNMSLYNSTTDGSATFASWRAAIDGVSPTSNFNVLDTYAQNTSASITALQVKSFYLVPAVYVSPNYYEANSLTSITAYTTGMYLDIYLDTTNVGSVTLNINALGTKTLKKVDATGALVDLDSNDLEKNKEYLFRYNGTYFVWVAVSSGASTAYSGSALITISGSKISHTVSGVSPGTYTSANLTVDDYGHLTAVSNGTSASSTGAPSDTPFLVSGSVSAGVTNAKQLVGGSYIVLTESGSTIIVASDCIPLSEISGSGVMSDTTGSIVKHNYSGVVSGSANVVHFDKYGHIDSGSIVPFAVSSSFVAGQALQTYDGTTGLFTTVNLPLTAGSVAGYSLGGYDASSGSFVMVPSSSGGRELLTSARTYYVRTDGNDSNTGLVNSAGGAFLTIQKAVDVSAALDCSIYNITIQVADGTYAASGVISCKNILGAGEVTIQGNNSTPANVVIDSGFAKTTPGTKYIVKDLKLQKSSSSITQALAASGGAILDYGNLVFGTGYTTHISCGTYASITCIGNYAISGAASYHLYSSGYATISMGGKTVTISGTPAFTAFCISSSKATIVAVTITWSGSATGQRFVVNIDGLINTGGGGANYFPGNSAGDSTGGTYI